MKAEKPAPETDKEPNAPHPRETFSFVGHDDEERALAEALRGTRMHHAWMLTGAKGLGKATLAYRFARMALGARSTGPRPLDVDAQDQIVGPVTGRAAGPTPARRARLDAVSGKSPQSSRRHRRTQRVQPTGGGCLQKGVSRTQ